MTRLHIQQAFEYFNEHINRIGRFTTLEEHGFSIVGSVPSIDWELFGSILTGRKSKPGYGADLNQYEVKSAVEGNSFEYQYHLNAGETKLDEDRQVDHIFISYARDYKNVTVRLVEGSLLAETFENWRPGLIENYSGENPKQRYRKSVSLTRVKNLGRIVMKIVYGNLQSVENEGKHI